MCTLVFIPKDENHYLLGMNRDESRDRPEATELQKSKDSLYPIDPLGGGTWLGASSFGLTLALLNQTPQLEFTPPTKQVSRGLLIPEIFTVFNPKDTLSVAQLAEKLQYSNYQPFLLLGFGPRGGVSSVHWDGARALTQLLPRETLMWSSSSFQESEVLSYRRSLFEKWRQSGPGASPATSDEKRVGGLHRFLTETDGSPNAKTVFMERSDARTVSTSLIEYSASQIRFKYFNRITLIDQGSLSCVNSR